MSRLILNLLSTLTILTIPLYHAICPEVRIDDHFHLQNYSGLWYENAQIPPSNKTHCTTVLIKLRREGQYSEDTRRVTLDAEAKSITTLASGNILATGISAVSVFWPVKYSKTDIFLGAVPNKFIIVYTCFPTGPEVKVLTRDVNISNSTKFDINLILKWSNFPPIAQTESPIQSNCTKHRAR